MSKVEALITARQLRKLLHYEPKTGVFTWKKSNGSKSASSIAGSCRKNGYQVVCLLKKRYYAHRLAWLYMHGEWPQLHIDHINGDPSDNRIENLRDVPPGVNLQNQRRAHKNNRSTGLLGASYRKSLGKYYSKIRQFGRVKHLGYFDTPEEAHQAYLNAKRQLHEGNTL